MSSCKLDHSPEEALALIRQEIKPLGHELVPLRKARGRCLAEDLYAVQSLPPFSRVCMDGIAVAFNANSLGPWRHSGQHFAGQRASRLVDPESAIEVSTGAVIPEGSDTVICYEQLSRVDNFWHLAEGIIVSPKRNVQEVGSELANGELIFKRGDSLRSPDLSLMASQGWTDVLVRRRPRIALISNGSELVRIDQAIESHQIRDSNREGLACLFADHGYDIVFEAHVADDETELTQAIHGALENADVLVLSAGVSRGLRDYVPQVLESLDVKTLIRTIRQKPGKPFYFGKVQGSKCVFGLPGNPVAALMNAAVYVLPALFALEQRFWKYNYLSAPQDLGSDAVARLLAVRSGEGDNLSELSIGLSSGHLAGLRGTSGLVLVPAEQRVAKGDQLVFSPWSPLAGDLL